MIKIEYQLATGQDLDAICHFVGIYRKLGESDIDLRKRLIQRKGVVSEFNYSLDNIYS